ncbi:MAG: hypothetical protein ACKO1M_09945 [Planctomycetota bacterium]
MPEDRTVLVLGILLVALGGGWLLSSMGFIPAVEWAWTIGLAVVGVLAVTLSGFDKVSFVVGGFFGLASLFSMLRQLAVMPAAVEVPSLVLSAGVVLLLARSRALPLPRWIANG